MARTAGTTRLVALALLATFASVQSSGLPTVVGCFSTSQPLVNQGYYKYQSSGHCSDVCTKQNQAVLGLSDGNICWCGDELPSADSKVSNSKCNTPCQGYDEENCGGGRNYYTVWLTGTESDVPNYKSSSSDSDHLVVAASSVTGTASATSSTPDIPLSLWSVAESLISSYYPSTTLHDLATATFPATVVIDGSTYIVPAKTTSTPTTLSTRTPQTAASTPTGAAAEDNKSGSQDQSVDKKLGIILGVVLGALAVVIMAVVFLCLRRRKRNTGKYFRGRTPSTRSNGSWMPGGRMVGRANSTFGTTTYVSTGGPNKWDQPTASSSISPEHRLPPMAMHPAIRGESSRSTSDDNRYYTPPEQGSTTTSSELGGQEIQKEAELEHDGPAQRSSSSTEHDGRAQRRSSSTENDTRPPTPFSPLMMMRQASGANTQQQRYNTQRQNPFSSEEDDEADDLVSPIVPTRSPERRHSPMVHYPSWSEVSDFDFSGQGRNSGRNRHEDDGGDGYDPTRERRDGRYELA